MSRHISEEQHQHPHEYIGDAILGLNDGITTTLVFALSVAGASGKADTVILTGLAEMFAGGVAMFLGGFMSAQSEKEAVQHQILVERHEIEVEPEEEREELTEIYREKGFSGHQLASIVDHLTGDKDRWLNSMIHDELLIRPNQLRSPWRVASVVGISFIIGALIPILPFIARVAQGPLAAAVLSIVALFVTGVMKSRYSHSTWIRSGAEMVLVGILGAAAGLVIGRILASRS